MIFQSLKELFSPVVLEVAENSHIEQKNENPGDVDQDTKSSWI